jgi:creatinine amidohydrolase
MAVRHLADLAFPEVSVDPRILLLVPLGSCEQHGQHLPLDTDTRIGVAIANAVGARRDDLLIAPPLNFGASGEHEGFAGTLSIGSDALRIVLVELARSLGPEFGGLVLLSWHGGNADAVRQAVTQLRVEGHRVLSIAPTVPSGDAHAGRTETSIMLSLAPGAVRMDRAAAGDTRPLTELMPLLRQGGLRAVTETGVLGDPAGASAAEGAELFSGVVLAVDGQIERWRGSVAW